MGQGNGPQAVAHDVAIRKIAKDSGWDPQDAEREIFKFSHTATTVKNAPDFETALNELHAKGLLHEAPKYAGMVVNNADISIRLKNLGIDTSERETQARFGALATGLDGGTPGAGPGRVDNYGVPGQAAQPSKKSAKISGTKGTR